MLGRNDQGKTWSSALDPATDDRIGAMRGPFKCHLESVPKGSGFILKEPHSDNKRDHHGKQTPDETEHDRESCIPDSLGAGFARRGQKHLLKKSARRRMANGCQTRAATPNCKCGMMKDMQQDHTLACQRKLMETEDTRQGSSRQTANLESVSPQQTCEWSDGQGNTICNVPVSGVVATLPGKDELRWRDIAIRRPT